MSQLLDFLLAKGGSTPLGMRLDLMHTANGEDFVTIVTDGQINVSECTVFKGEELAYFFLGRPAYKTPISFDPSVWQLPAVFVFSPLDDIPRRVYPFDSGAYFDERYKEIVGKINISSFECGSDPADTSRLIDLFFSSIERYRRAQPVSYETIDSIVADDRRHYIPLALAKLYNHNLNQVIDDRARIIEYQYDRPVSLRRREFKGVICCAEWLRDPVLAPLLDDLGGKTLSYPILPLSSSSYYAKIYELAEELSR